MTRTLPWKRDASSLVRKSSPAVRRQVRGSNVVRRKEQTSITSLAAASEVSDSNGQDTPPRRTSKPQTREPSTSPIEPSSPMEEVYVPKESFMKDGLDKDDRYRMVEDEFLDIAKQFTRHLHAAEYKRLKREARSQNAVTISSISRPVTVRMPDHTRRKVEGIARGRKQARTLRGLLGKQDKRSGSEENSDDDERAWAGTPLYNLMGTTQKSTASLVKTGGAINPTTRAAAGFKKHHAPRGHRELSASQQERNIITSRPGNIDEDVTSSEDDDLDGPAPARKTSAPIQQSRLKVISDDTPREPLLIANISSRIRSMREGTVRTSSSSTVTYHDLTYPVSPPAESNARVARRRLQSRTQIKKEDSGQKEMDLDVIPTFL